MGDKFLYSLKMLFLLPFLLFTWKEQDGVFALQGKHFYFNFFKVTRLSVNLNCQVLPSWNEVLVTILDLARDGPNNFIYEGLLLS